MDVSSSTSVSLSKQKPWPPNPQALRRCRRPQVLVSRGARVYETCIRNAKLDAMRNSESPNTVLNHPNHGPLPILFFDSFPSLLHDDGRKTLGVLHVHGLHEAVELLLGALLVVTSPGDADAESVRDALDTLLPHLLVELGV